MKHAHKQEILDEPRPLRRLEKLNNILLDELEVLKIEMQIRAKTRDRMMATSARASCASRYAPFRWSSAASPTR